MRDTYTISLIGITLALFTVLFFLTKRFFTFINLIVIIFMAALVSPLLLKLIPVRGMPYPCLSFTAFLRAAPFTFGPLLYFYAKAQTGKMTRFRIPDLMHFLPFFIFSVFTIHASPGPGMPPPHMHPPVDIHPVYFIANYNFVFHTVFFFTLTLYISLGIYTILVIMLIGNHNKTIEDYFTSDSIEISLNWIKWIVICFSFSYVAVLTVALFFRFINYNMEPVMPALSDILTVFFIFMFSFFAMKQPEIYETVSDNDNPCLPVTKPDKRYEKSGLRDDVAEKYYRQIIKYMASEKPYTDPDLTISKLSEQLGITRHHLTQVINEKINRNFFMFVNEYRVNEVKQKIEHDTENKHSILRLAFDAGFNSKSTFNTIFKKTTGMTPSEFRKSITEKKQY